MYRYTNPQLGFYAFRRLYADISTADLCALDVHKMPVLKLLKLCNKMRVFP